jgi:hypothetical protein
MKWPLTLLAVVFSWALLYTVSAWAQMEVLVTGTDDAGYTRTAKVDSEGNIQTVAGTHAACTHTATTVTTSATAVPASARTDRRNILVQLITATGQTMTCTADGMSATTARGLQVGAGEAISISLRGSVQVSCVCSLGECDARAMECP